MTLFYWHISLQHDWRDILRSPDQRAWITCTKAERKNIYGEIFKLVGASKEIKATQGVQASYSYEENIQLSFDGTTSYFYSPTKSFKDIHYKSINSLNISTGGSLGVSSSDDGNLLVWQTEDGKLRRTLEGHVSDVTHCRFFPSGMVVLSGGSDMMLKIWSVEDGSCPVTLVGHTGAITDTCIIDRGRNFISCGRDGYVKLWDCGTAKCLLNLCEGGSVINRCLLSTHTWNPANQIVDRSEHESGTEGKLLVIAKEAGSLEGVDVFSREKVFKMNTMDAVNSCCFIDEYRLVAGLQNGSLTMLDTRKACEPEMVLKHGKSSVTCMETYYKNRCLVGRSDGSCSSVCLDDLNSKGFVTQEFLGPNQDPIYDISTSKHSIYTGCRDGVIRKYNIKKPIG